MITGGTCSVTSVIVDDPSEFCQVSLLQQCYARLHSNHVTIPFIIKHVELEKGQRKPLCCPEMEPQFTRELADASQLLVSKASSLYTGVYTCDSHKLCML